MKVCHVTSVHQRYDVRIFHKEMKSLSKIYRDLFLICADGRGDEVIQGIDIRDVGVSKNRVDRMLRITKHLLVKAKEIDADVYHLHDPELIPIGLQLKRWGKVVVFDAHEDVPKQLRGKQYLNKFAKVVLSNFFSIFERYACAKLDAVIAATPSIRKKFVGMGVRSIDINNYPLLDELAAAPIDWSQKEPRVAYVGGIGRVRGIMQVVQSFCFVKTRARLVLAGEFNNEHDEAEARNITGWERVDPLGFVDRQSVRGLLSQCVGGLVTFLPLPNHIDAQPNKMFEYMSAGLPVIGSNFPLWRQIVDGNSCGLCVDPLDPEAIAEAIDYLISHPAEAEEMGRNGQRAVKERYNWGVEEEKLFDFYESLVG